MSLLYGEQGTGLQESTQDASCCLQLSEGMYCRGKPCPTHVYCSICHSWQVELQMCGAIVSGIGKGYSEQSSMRPCVLYCGQFIGTGHIQI